MQPCFLQADVETVVLNYFEMRTSTAILAGFLGLWCFAVVAEETKFAGTWEATSGDKVFLVLKLQAGAKISGTMNAGSISMDDEVNLLEAGPV